MSKVVGNGHLWSEMDQLLLFKIHSIMEWATKTIIRKIQNARHLDATELDISLDFIGTESQNVISI